MTGVETRLGAAARIGAACGIAAAAIVATVLAAGPAGATDFGRQTNVYKAHKVKLDPNAYLAETLETVNEMGEPKPGGIAAQGQWLTGAVSLSFQGGYTGQLDRFDPNQVNGAFLNGEVHYFLGENLMLGGSLGYTGIREEAATIHGFRWGASVETLLPMTLPVSVFLAYQGNHGEWTLNDKKHDDNAVKAGFRLRLDQGSLFETDRKNANGFGGFSILGR
ncbi:MAG: hypothetical protein U1E56_01275 [Bauldia sp.]